MSRQCIDVDHKYNERNQRKSISKLLKRETKLIQLEKVQFFIVLRAEKLTGKEMKDILPLTPNFRKLDDELS